MRRKQFGKSRGVRRKQAGKSRGGASETSREIKWGVRRRQPREKSGRWGGACRIQSKALLPSFFFPLSALLLLSPIFVLLSSFVLFSSFSVLLSSLLLCCFLLPSPSFFKTLSSFRLLSSFFCLPSSFFLCPLSSVFGIFSLLLPFSPFFHPPVTRTTTNSGNREQRAEKPATNSSKPYPTANQFAKNARKPRKVASLHYEQLVSRPGKTAAERANSAQGGACGSSAVALAVFASRFPLCQCLVRLLRAYET